ncbi:MAG TPA: hypothetical protein VII19_03515 [Acidimicrobiales bacterium]
MPQHPMADDELVAFLTDEPARTGKLATVRADGRPHVAPSGSPSTRPIEGIATVGEDLEEVAHWATVIGGCYMGPENAGQYGRRNSVPGELVVRVRPTNIVAVAEVAD